MIHMGIFSGKMDLSSRMRWITLIMMKRGASVRNATCRSKKKRSIARIAVRLLTIERL